MQAGLITADCRVAAYLNMMERAFGMTQVSIIIISYNTREMTLACLHSIYQQTQRLSYEIIVVDNNSNDNSGQAIAEAFPNLHLVILPQNIGFARANNLAATKAKGQYLLLLNPDTIILDNAVEQIYGFARKHPNYRLYGGRTLFGNHSLNPTSCWRQPTLWSILCYALGLVALFRRSSFFNPESYGKWERDSVREVDIVTGCFLLIERKLWDSLGGFDQQFFMYGEDADLCLRAAQIGAKPVITPDATIIHYCGASEKVRSDKMIRLLKAKGQLFLRHMPYLSARVGLVLLRCSVLFRVLACDILQLIGIKKFHDKCASWRVIWQRRKEWGLPIFKKIIY